MAIGFSAFACIVSTNHFTKNTLNPAVRLPVLFLDGEYAKTHYYLIPPFIGNILGIVFYYMF